MTSNVLVIGASRGIGLEFARQYLAAGDRVIATARDEAGLARLRELGAMALRVDVADPASISSLARQLDGESIDVALYVAGVWSGAGAAEPPAQPEFDRVMHANVMGAMQAIPQVTPLVAASRSHGRFAFITSGMAEIGTVASSQAWLYRVSKAALNMGVAAARHDYPDVIMVALSPGWVRTDMGGPGGSLSVEESVAAMRRTLAALVPADSGAFLQHDGRRFAGW